MASQIQTLPARRPGRFRSEALAAEIEHLETETMARYWLQRLEAEVLAPARGLSDDDARLRRIVSGYVSLAIDEPGVTTLLADGGARLSAGLREGIEGTRRALENGLTGIFLTRAQATGIDPTVAALSLLGIVHWGVSFFRAEGRLSREEALEQISHLALHGLIRQPACTQPGTPGGPGHRACAA